MKMYEAAQRERKPTSLRRTRLTSRFGLRSIPPESNQSQAKLRLRAACTRPLRACQPLSLCELKKKKSSEIQVPFGTQPRVPPTSTPLAPRLLATEEVRCQLLLKTPEKTSRGSRARPGRGHKHCPRLQPEGQILYPNSEPKGPTFVWILGPPAHPSEARAGALGD